MLDAPQSAAPPTVQGEFVPTRPPSSWPTVIGIIAIVLGSLGSLANAWALIAPLVMEAFLGQMSNDPAFAAHLQVQKDHLGWSLSSAGVNVIASLLLVVGGTGLCMRRRWGPTTIKLWIPLRMFGVVLGCVTAYVMMQATLKVQAAQGATPPPGFMSGFAAASIAVGLLWGWAFPVFMIVWLSRTKIRAQVADWS